MNRVQTIVPFRATCGERRRTKPRGWFLVITISMAMLMIPALVTVLYIKAGPPMAFACLGFLTLAGIGGLGTLFFGKDKVDIRSDERDWIIKRQTTLAGLAASYLVAGMACMVTFFMLGPMAVVSAAWLPNVLGAAGITFFLTHSLTLLIQCEYGLKQKGKQL